MNATTEKELFEYKPVEWADVEGWVEGKRIGDRVKYSYMRAPVRPEFQFPIGRLVEIYNDDKALVAKYQVWWSTENEVGGVITNTYGHKRRN